MLNQPDDATGTCTLYMSLATCIYVCLSGIWLGGLFYFLFFLISSAMHMYFHVVVHTMYTVHVVVHVYTCTCSSTYMI